MKMKRTLLSSAIAAAIAAQGAAYADDDDYREMRRTHRGDGEYRTGDFHNHTTCSDGSTSVRTLTRKSLGYHDWFVHVGHSGRGSRDCRVEDFIYINRSSADNRGLWINTVGPDAIKGDYRDEGMSNGDRAQTMWRWQSLQEFNLPSIVEEREYPGNDDKVAFLGLEWVVPGHEHSSNSIITGQYDDTPNADGLAQFEYCFAGNSDDTSQGGGQGWTCELSNESNDKLIELFAGRTTEGDPDYNGTLVGGINTDDSGAHVKAAAAMLWKQENHPDKSFHVHAHIERQGGFVPGQNRGWNIEHIRDMNTLAPEVSIGMESQPGHQAQSNRGSYTGGRPTAGFWTYGGTGAYAAAEVSKPGFDFAGNPIDPATTPECQEPGVNCSSSIERNVLSRPGVRTMWDALLSEGRRFWFFGSSDWHSRGSFGPLDFESDNDFWPGEYQDNFTYIVDNNPDDPAQDVVDGLRSGNVFVVMGQLIDAMSFEACSQGKCATMGETLKVKNGAPVRVTLTVRDPKGESNSPYTFDNPALTQIGIEQPLNQPELAHVELIRGAVTGPVPVHTSSGDLNPEYFNPLAPATTHIARQWTSHDWGWGPVKRMTYTFRADGDAYLRTRGSNLPPGTPFARDMDGNPLADNLRGNIPCLDALCPPHVNGVLDKDLEAWADIWFHSNPIFIEVDDRKGGKGGRWYAWNERDDDDRDDD